MSSESQIDAAVSAVFDVVLRRLDDKQQQQQQQRRASSPAVLTTAATGSEAPHPPAPPPELLAALDALDVSFPMATTTHAAGVTDVPYLGVELFSCDSGAAECGEVPSPSACARTACRIRVPWAVAQQCSLITATVAACKGTTAARASSSAAHPAAAAAVPPPSNGSSGAPTAAAADGIPSTAARHVLRVPLPRATARGLDLLAAVLSERAIALVRAPQSGGGDFAATGSAALDALMPLYDAAVVAEVLGHLSYLGA
jgi:hypothetical protein